MTHIANCLQLNVASEPNMDVRDPAYSKTWTNFTADSSYSDLVRRANRWKQSSSPKYLLWPYQAKSPTTPQGESLSDEKAMALSVSRSATSLSDTVTRDHASPQEGPLTLRPKAGSFSRRRRPGVTELGSMATVQETGGVDSPTIPGRPPVRKLSKASRDPNLGHGRSSSAPGSSWRNNPFGDAMMSCVTEPATMNMQRISQEQSSNGSPSKKKASPAALFKPTQLEPIPSPMNPVTRESRPSLQIRTNPETMASPTDDIPPVPPPKSAPIGGRNSPASNRPTPTRKNSSTALGRLASTPQRPTERVSAESLVAKSPDSKVVTPATATSASPFIHKRMQSETSALDGSHSIDPSVLHRGRPIKRTQSFDHHERTPSASSTSLSSSEPKEVWKLPTGFKRADAVHMLTEPDKQKLQRQAASQAEKFEVLNERDIATLSKELRALDERCDYLRKTYRSLRAGRQKLHARMMLYLKRENGAIFTRDGLIRQEEALAELDASLDDWISKIEQAENRRLRIRQKVLEHFCAAVTLSPVLVPEAQAVVMSPGQGVGVQGLQGCQEQTPPRSPVERAADSPKMFSVLPSMATATATATATTAATATSATSPILEEQEIKPLQMDSPKIGSPKLGDPEKRRDVQSIKIYADGNVLDLFTDIEQAIDNMFDYDEKRGVNGTINAMEHQEVVPTTQGNGRKGSTATA